MTRIYEELFIVKPDAPDEEVDQFVEHLRTQLTTAGATVDKVDKWGKRRLAYRVDKYREGTYVLLQFTAAPDTVKELEHRDKRAAKRAAAGPGPGSPAPGPAQPSLAQQMTESPAILPGMPKSEG